ncbi:hypothetical protein FHL15_007372 [Xylaria flabelliformis]|uniref:Uncharacterized protein n=1 Tax=Xylaria flabelliformis TaxID=2512241 RepID=A0A553HV45_9PEZI|nr:hypothetical protein FHL15_007372 [Xylaria flabelliformis]
MQHTWLSDFPALDNKNDPNTSYCGTAKTPCASHGCDDNPSTSNGTAANVPTAGSMPQHLQNADQKFWTRCRGTWMASAHYV